MVIVAPVVLLDGEKLVTTGAPVTVKFVELVTVPDGVVKDIFPVDALDGTVAVT
jgi:hypothetical protein